MILPVFTISVLLLEGMWCAEEEKRKSMLGAKYYDGKKIVLPISEDASRELFNHWLHQATGSVMSAFTTNRINKGGDLNEHYRYRFQKCSKEANTVQKHAHCVINVLSAEKNEMETHENKQSVPYDSIQTLLRRFFIHEPMISKRSPSKMKEKNQSYEDDITHVQKDNPILSTRLKHKNLRRISPRFQKYRPKLGQSSLEQEDIAELPPPAITTDWIGGFGVSRIRRSKRKISIVNRERYSMITKDSSRTPWGEAARIMKNVIRRLKGKRDLKSWFVTLAEIKELGELLKKKEAKKKKIKETIKAMVAAQERKASIEELRKIAGPVEIEIKNYDGVPFGFEQQLEELIMEHKKRFLAVPMKLLRDSIKLGLMLAGKNVTGFENKTVRFASPKFFSIVPEEHRDDEIRLLSPSLFNLHGGGEEMEKLFSIPGFIRAINSIKEGDHEDLLDFIFEAAGVTDALDTAKEKFMQREETVNSVRGIDGQPLYFTKENVTEIFGDVEKQKIDTFETIYATITPEQKDDLNKTGYSALSNSQLHMLYGEHSPYHDPSALARLTNITDKRHLHELLVNDIRLIANATEFGIQKTPQINSTVRSKRQIVLAPILLAPIILAPGTTSQPIILSPLVLSPVILSPAVLGPFILSPWVFIPLILSPSVLSPFILNPFILSPVVLSPLSLHPFILSPGVLNPLVLNPLALSPFILSPQALTPFVLSPLVFNPLVLTPMTLSPLVLSPFALSPIILSPQYIFALVLSPYLLSPVIASNLTASAIIFSPSFLSS